MIYSDKIDKICSLCRGARAIDGNEDEVYCERLKKNKAAAEDACAEFSYDIFKKRVRRRPRLKTDFDPEDFTL